MAITTTLSGVELAEYLAKHLSDLEFELLIRARIKWEFDNVHTIERNLSESYNSCSFQMSWGDEATWRIGIGETYSKSADISGQVLGKCMMQVTTLYNMKNSNKLSRLLPAPDPTDGC